MIRIRSSTPSCDSTLPAALGQVPCIVIAWNDNINATHHLPLSWIGICLLPPRSFYRTCRNPYNRGSRRHISDYDSPHSYQHPVAMSRCWRTTALAPM